MCTAVPSFPGPDAAIPGPRPAAPRRQTLRWHERLHRDREFSQVFADGRKMAHPAFFMYVLHRRDGRSLRRMGLVTGRKVGSAPERNRAKRLLREVFRLHKHGLEPGVDVVFVLRPRIVGISYQGLCSAVTGLWTDAGMFDQARR